MPRKGLSDLVPGYPENYPQTLAGLLDADIEDVPDDIARELRSQALSAVRSSDLHYINGPWDVLDLITSGYVLHPWEKAWKSYALSSTRQPILTPSEKGRMRYHNKATRLIPKSEDLPPLPKQGNGVKPAWLVIYGGTPDILEKETVRKGLVKLSHRVSVADIVFYDNSVNEQPRLWSIAAGTGLAGTNRTSAVEVPFPEPSYVEDIRSRI